MLGSLQGQGVVCTTLQSSAQCVERVAGLLRTWSDPKQHDFCIAIDVFERCVVTSYSVSPLDDETVVMWVESGVVEHDAAEPFDVSIHGHGWRM
ncbi:hypothetical protein UUA_15308 [Rhodanobacter thiooxydans LCS2]|nr:hypothetical protein UUA_15308 [Rhodanobacter thiooxydans LCS2]